MQWKIYVYISILVFCNIFYLSLYYIIFEFVCFWDEFGQVSKQQGDGNIDYLLFFQVRQGRRLGILGLNIGKYIIKEGIGFIIINICSVLINFYNFFFSFYYFILLGVGFSQIGFQDIKFIFGEFELFCDFRKIKIQKLNCYINICIGFGVLQQK